ncbi:MAG: Asp-tRNA(Asn)/Glu-tRNA(Gln) amidotransferase subunit GatC [Ignavibacteria bacterium]|nr:Asp-tRNA(Asn)/Glu-tRNA(Gln) amidotransferase subunit GatC [Ignavibacteria bacterium]
MSVTVKDVEHVAKLARLEFSETEKEVLTHELNEILGYIEKLNELDTTNVEPLSHVIELSNVVRDDVVRQSASAEEMLQNAPDRTEKFFRVPKVIGER